MIMGLTNFKVARTSFPIFDSFNFKKGQSKKEIQSHGSAFVEMDYKMNVWLKATIISLLAVTMATLIKDYLDLLFGFQHW